MRDGGSKCLLYNDVSEMDNAPNGGPRIFIQNFRDLNALARYSSHQSTLLKITRRYKFF